MLGQDRAALRRMVDDLGLGAFEINALYTVFRKIDVRDRYVVTTREVYHCACSLWALAPWCPV